MLGTMMLLMACGSSSTPPPAPTTSPPAASTNAARQVAECKECGAGETCVEQVQMVGPKRSCVATAPACTDGAASCACMPEACAAPYDTCNMNGPVMTCSCITC